MSILSIHLCGAAHTATHRRAQQKTDGTKQDNYIRKHVSRTVLSLCTLLYIYTSWVEVSIFDTGICEQNVNIIKNILLIVFFTGNLLVIPNKIINFAEV